MNFRYEMGSGSLNSNAGNVVNSQPHVPRLIRAGDPALQTVEGTEALPGKD